MKRVHAEMTLYSNYEYDEDDPIFMGRPQDEIAQLVKYMFLIDAVENMPQEDHFRMMKITFED